MYKLIDKLILFIICTALFLPNSEIGLTGVSLVHSLPAIATILVIITVSAAVSYLEIEWVNITVFVLFLVLCINAPAFIFYIPLLCYDGMMSGQSVLFLLGLIPVAVNYDEYSPIMMVLIVLFVLIAFILKRRTNALIRLRKEYYDLLDSSKDVSLQLEAKNKELIDRQDYEISLATLHERNRIARDIHDNVGHLLSSSILQIGAVLITVKDEKTRENVGLIKDTLASAMDSIRNSVHDLHEEAVDLQTEIESLIRSFTFCPVQYEYSVQTAPDKNLKYCFISVTKETLNNISRHSNATNASIKIREHPGLYQLVIQDNGTASGEISESGIGLKNIADRVAALNGNLNISSQKGFRIFISIPK